MLIFSDATSTYKQECIDEKSTMRSDGAVWNRTATDGSCGKCKCQSGYADCTAPPYTCPVISSLCSKINRPKNFCCDVCDDVIDGDKSDSSVGVSSDTANKNDIMVPIAIGIGVFFAIVAAAFFLVVFYKKRCSSNGLHSKVRNGFYLVYGHTSDCKF